MFTPQLLVTMCLICVTAFQTVQAQTPATSPTSLPATTQPAENIRAALVREAESLESFVQSPLARRFLAAAAQLPRVEPRTIYISQDRKTVLSREQAEKLTTDERAALRERQIDETYYYQTRYGSPLAYARAIDLLAQNGLDDFANRRVLDFGYGMCGQLLMMAELNAKVVGVDVDPTLPVIYHDLAGGSGRVRVVNGRWPAEDDVRNQVGGEFDVILSKNTLKFGYIHPERPVDERMTIQLGVDDEMFVRRAFEALRPNGKLMIYNLCPAPAPPDKPYIPWANGRCPFARETLEKAGFRVIEFDRDDSSAAREMGRRLRWHEPPTSMNLETDLFAWYTLAEKPR